MSKLSLAPALETCIQECTDCYQACLKSISHCLILGGDQDRDHVRLLLDCSEICQTNVSFLLRNSQAQSITCKACAEVCARLAEVCSSAGACDLTLTECARLCLRCGQSCLALSE